MPFLPIPQHVIPNTPEGLTLVSDGASLPQEQLAVSAVLETPLLKKDTETMKTFCGNRYCKRSGSVSTWENGPFVDTWVDKCSDGHDREFGIRSYTLFPAYHENGVPYRFCPHCGEELISVCRNCGSKICSGDHAYCIGCGHYLWRTYAEDQPISGDVAPLNDESSAITDDFPF